MVIQTAKLGGMEVRKRGGIVRGGRDKRNNTKERGKLT